MTSPAPSHTTPLPCGPVEPLSDALDVLDQWLRTDQPCWLLPGSHARVELRGLPPQAPAQAVIVATSGSSGTAKRTVLSRDAVVSAIHATHAQLGGAGGWVHTLPTHYVAGLMVLLRALVGGTVVQRCGSPLTVDALRCAVNQLPAGRRYVSLVPTQLVELSNREGTEVLRGFDAVLVGGGPTPPSLRAHLADAGVQLVATYGASETAGGCVYNGVPLPGVNVTLGEDGRIVLAGPMLSQGYLRPTGQSLSWDDDLTQATFPLQEGRRVFLTSDLGTLDGDGVLSVTGRADDIIISGGVKVWPTQVEAALHSEFPQLRVAVVGVPHPKWGECVTAVWAGDVPRALPPLAEVRERLRPHLPAASLPHAMVQVEAWPVLVSGKPDRVRLRQLACAGIPVVEGAADTIHDVAE